MELERQIKQGDACYASGLYKVRIFETIKDTGTSRN